MSVRVMAIRLRKSWAALTLLLVVTCAAVAYARWWPSPPDAAATLQAAPAYPGIKGRVAFRKTRGGTLVTVDVSGLPAYTPGQPPLGPHGFHIHEGASCEVGDAANPFQTAGGHWNPDGQPHGNHAGDFPVLFSHDGHASLSFFTNRFTPEEVVGRTVIIHLHPDDYRTQPAGDSGQRIACGVIVRYAR